MRQFLNGSLKAWQNLELRATGACIRFANQQMPSGCKPGFADIGFEIDEEDQLALLLVEMGIEYTGNNPEICSWLENGEKAFDNFHDLKTWIMECLALEFEPEKGLERDTGTHKREDSPENYLAIGQPAKQGHPGCPCRKCPLIG